MMKEGVKKAKPEDVVEEITQEEPILTNQTWA
jgi:hypothetical protein